MTRRHDNIKRVTARIVAATTKHDEYRPMDQWASWRAAYLIRRRFYTLGNALLCCQMNRPVQLVGRRTREGHEWMSRWLKGHLYVS